MTTFFRYNCTSSRHKQRTLDFQKNRYKSYSFLKKKFVWFSLIHFFHLINKKIPPKFLFHSPDKFQKCSFPPTYTLIWNSRVAWHMLKTFLGYSTTLESYCGVLVGFFPLFILTIFFCFSLVQTAQVRGAVAVFLVVKSHSFYIHQTKHKVSSHS